MTKVREWRNKEWATSDKAADQETLVRMYRKIMGNADTVNITESGSDCSRCIVALCSWQPNMEYVIHITGFEVEDITEIYRDGKQLEQYQNRIEKEGI